MSTIGRVSVMAALCAVGACGSKDKDKAKQDPAPALAKDAGASVSKPADAAPAAAPPAAASSLVPSLDEYCAEVSAKFTKHDCYSQGDDAELCACEPATKDTLAGNTTATGSGGHVKGAALVAVADSAADFVHCSVAVQLAGGWHVQSKVFPCAPAPVSHDGGVEVTVNRFVVNKDTVSLDWTETRGGSKTAYGLVCTASAADRVECGTPAAKP